MAPLRLPSRRKCCRDCVQRRGPAAPAPPAWTGSAGGPSPTRGGSGHRTARRARRRSSYGGAGPRLLARRPGAAVTYWLQFGAFGKLDGAEALRQYVAEADLTLLPLLTIVREAGLHRLRAG